MLLDKVHIYLKQNLYSLGYFVCLCGQVNIPFEALTLPTGELKDLKSGFLVPKGFLY